MDRGYSGDFSLECPFLCLIGLKVNKSLTNLYFFRVGFKRVIVYGVSSKANAVTRNESALYN